MIRHLRVSRGMHPRAKEWDVSSARHRRNSKKLQDRSFIATDTKIYPDVFSSFVLLVHHPIRVQGAASLHDRLF